MLAHNYLVQDIAEITGFSVEDIQALGQTATAANVMTVPQ